MHLRDLGHRHLGLVTIDQNYPQGEGQHCGAHEAITPLLENQQATLHVQAVERNRSALGESAARQLLAVRPRPTAILCGSDDLAEGVLRVVAQLGLTVPKDISIVGWNDVLAPPAAPVPMTSVHPDDYGLAQRAMQRLLALIENPHLDRPSFEVPATLIVRESTSPPPASAPASD